MKETALSHIYEKMFKNLIITVSSLAYNNKSPVSLEVISNIAYTYLTIKNNDFTDKKEK